MLEYRLDDLHWAEFEKLCQALLKARLGVGVESWGGSGDWGNDAYCQAPLRYPGTEVEDGPFQFQAKFVQGANAAGSKPNAALVAAVKRECERITKRKQPIPRVYSLLTNVVLSPELRKTIETMIKGALPGCAIVVVHHGEDICSWLHLHEQIVRVFPQLLSHRNLTEVIRRSLYADTQDEKVATGRELSAVLKEAKNLARIASRRHDADSALVLWERVQSQAEEEGNKAEELGARLETVLILLQDEPNAERALKLADACLQDAQAVDLGRNQCRLLHIIGEVHRVRGNRDQARGFATRALECSRRIGSLGDEGYALLALSAMEESPAGIGESNKALELIELAYNAFSSLYAIGDGEKQATAKDGFAQCHSWRAEILDHWRPDDALSEWTRSIEIFKSLGEGWEWDVAQAFLSRADLHARIGERQRAAADLDEAARVFQRIGNTVGLARCYVRAGELLDLMGKRDTAAEPYQQAAAIAATWKNERKASYFYFRHACKLMELKKYDDAKRILTGLADGGWLEPEIKLTVISHLCLIAHATEARDEFKERSSLALVLIDELIESAVSAERRRSLLIEKGQLLEQVGQHDEALTCFHAAIKRFEAVHDQVGVAECWFQIRGVLHTLGDRKGEREAAERVLALAADGLSSILVGLTLVGLARLNIWEQRFSEARQQLDRAEKLQPDNPAVAVVAADLRRQLPQFSSEGPNEQKRLHQPPTETLASLLQELRDWCMCYPAKQSAILPVWYYIHRTGLPRAIRSMLGVKFLIHSADAATFEKVKNALIAHGDLFIWGTNFGSKTKSKAELIPVPKGFIFPAGTKILAQRPKGSDSGGGTKTKKDRPLSESRILVPDKALPNEPYYLAFVKGVDGFPDVSSFFAGRKCRLDPKISKFMLPRPTRDLIAEHCICFPLTEGLACPNLKRTMRVAWENGAIPVFSANLPQDDEISCACDCMIELPSADEALVALTKDVWLELLSDTEVARSSLANFSKRMAALRDTEHRARPSVRAYMLRFNAGNQQVVHPAVVVLPQ